jgi:hypothetical protein
MKGERVDLKNVPTGAWIFASTAVIAILGGLVVLSVSHTSTTDFWRLLNLLFNLAGVVAGSGGLVYAGAAARNSQAAAQRLNGGLDARIREAVHKAMDARTPPSHKTDPSS